MAEVGPSELGDPFQMCGRDVRIPAGAPATAQHVSGRIRPSNAHTVLLRMTTETVEPTGFSERFGKMP
ncbi:hypothetical protein ACQY0O_005092 [Thecaphora frezii]